MSVAIDTKGIQNPASIQILDIEHVQVSRKSITFNTAKHIPKGLHSINATQKMRTSTAFLPSVATLALAQQPAAWLQSVGFNSSFTLTPEQISAGQLDQEVALSVENATRFDDSQLAFGGPHEDDFYTLPPLTNITGPLKAGQVLKVQAYTDPTSYVIPPTTGLSRILYTTTNINGTVVPASAFILWPFQPRQFRDGESSTADGEGVSAPAVVWAHGTSGHFTNGAPSARRDLWYANAAPFTLAQAGYAVVAPDYAGLGISHSWDGSFIPHQYLISPAAAADALYAMSAAQDAFAEELSGEYVVMGHSQGGGVAWSVAELLASQADTFADVIDGYRGAISGSPTVEALAGLPQFIVSWVSLYLADIFPGFRQEEWLTPTGIARTQLLKDIEGCIGVSQQLFLTGEDPHKPGYEDTWYAEAYSKLANAGRKDFRGPLMVIHATADVYNSFNVTEAAVKETWELFPDNDLEFVVIPGIGHVPALDATRPRWLQWIEERFERKPVPKQGPVRTTVNSWLPLERYSKVGGSFLQWAGLPEFSYQAILGL